MRISDWSSDVCSSDLDSVLERIDSGAERGVTRMLTMMLDPLVGEKISYLVPPDGSRIDMVDPGQLWERVTARIDRKSVVSGKSVSVRVDIGGRRIIKKKKMKEYQTYRRDNIKK